MHPTSMIINGTMDNRSFQLPSLISLEFSHPVCTISHGRVSFCCESYCSTPWSASTRPENIKNVQLTVSNMMLEPARVPMPIDTQSPFKPENSTMNPSGTAPNTGITIDPINFFYGVSNSIWLPSDTKSAPLNRQNKYNNITCNTLNTVNITHAPDS